MTLRGVLITVLATLLTLVLALFAYDYRAVRIAAAKGAASYEFLEKIVAAQKAAPPPAQEEKK